MQLAAERTMPVQLELGGKAPIVVFADADLESVVSAATLAATYNTGQDCTAATRVYVESSVHDRLLDALATGMDSVAAGDPLDPATDIGPLISSDHRDRVHGFVERAGAGGCAGRRRWPRVGRSTAGSIARLWSQASRKTPSWFRTRCSGRCGDRTVRRRAPRDRARE
jgi:acyl-CoA reductase-like NAD-dependent aldehyde dehydrogenase